MGVKVVRIGGAFLSVGAAVVVGFFWSIYGLFVIMQLGVEHTDDGPTCYHAFPELAVPLAVIGVVGLAALLLAGGLAARASLTGRVSGLLLGATVTFVAAAMLVPAVLTVAPPQPTDSGVCANGR
jgi:hypothetical protein